jgi:RNA polymerase sigma-70 factor (ECF subfamily)
MNEHEIPEVYRQTIGPLYAFVSRRCGGERALAEDVVQETWLRAVDVWRKQGMPDAPAAWLTTVARNLLVSHFRQRKPVTLDAIAAESTLAAVDDGFAKEHLGSVQMIQWGLAQLPASQAGILEAFHFDERPMASIAKDLRTSERAVEGRLRRARLKLRRLIERTLARQTKQRSFR